MRNEWRKRERKRERERERERERGKQDRYSVHLCLLMYVHVL